MTKYKNNFVINFIPSIDSMTMSTGNISLLVIWPKTPTVSLLVLWPKSEMMIGTTFCRGRIFQPMREGYLIFPRKICQNIFFMKRVSQRSNRRRRRRKKIHELDEASTSPRSRELRFVYFPCLSTPRGARLGAMTDVEKANGGEKTPLVREAEGEKLRTPPSDPHEHLSSLAKILFT